MFGSTRLLRSLDKSKLSAIACSRHWLLMVVFD